jgi:hypothetical protein
LAFVFKYLTVLFGTFVYLVQFRTVSKEPISRLDLRSGGLSGGEAIANFLGNRNDFLEFAGSAPTNSARTRVGRFGSVARRAEARLAASYEALSKLNIA